MASGHGGQNIGQDVAAWEFKQALKWQLWYQNRVEELCQNFQPYIAEPVNNGYSPEGSLQQVSFAGNPLPDRSYYHVHLATTYDDNWSEMVMDHWKHNRPPGVKETYPETAPEIFWNGRATDGYDDLAKYGYLHDSGGFNSLWTVGQTEYTKDIKKTEGPLVYKYLTVLALEKPDDMPFYYVNTEVINLSDQEQAQEAIIARRKSEHAHVDAYIFTPAAQARLKRNGNFYKILRTYVYNALCDS